eukprot:gene14019-9877_t
MAGGVPPTPPPRWSRTSNMSIPVRIEVPLGSPGANATGWEMLTFQRDRAGLRHRYFWGITMNGPDSVWWDQLSQGGAGSDSPGAPNRPGDGGHACPAPSPEGLRQ